MGREDSSNRYQLIESLYQEAIELPGELRAGFLAGRCGSDSAVREEVLELLRHFEAAPGNFLQQPAHDLPRQLDALQRLPERIGGYEIIALLGRGGMGAVYEAQQSQPRRRVALKVVRADALDPDALRRFRHEAELLGQLEHPGIARLYEFGLGPVWHDGAAGHEQPFFAMELVRGLPLGQFVAARKLDRHAVIELLIRVCDAVHHAHQKGIIHRDLKPSNIVVGEDGQPRVLDFGVARALRNSGDTLTAHTAHGQLLGTLQYMSPEQFAGRAQLADTRSDLYSLGVVSYELLAGRPPFDVAGLTTPEAIRVLAEREPRPAGAVKRELRGDLQAILGKALERDPERRYSSAADLAADLRRHLRHEPILARSPALTYRLAKFVRRNRVLVGGAALLLATCLGATVWITAAMLQAQRANLRALAINDFMRDILASADPASGRADVRLVEVLRAAADEAVERFAESPDQEAEIRTTLGLAFSNLSLYSEALTHIERARQLLRAARGDNDPATLRASGHLADLLNRDHRYAAAEELARDLLTRTAPDSLVGISARRTIAFALGARNRLSEAEQELRGALASARQRLGAFHRVTLASSNDLALLLHMRAVRNLSQDRAKDIQESVDLFRATLEDATRAFGADGFATLNIRCNLANALRLAGRLDEAAAFAEEVLAEAPGRFGEDHRFCTLARTALINVRLEQGRFEDAATHAIANVRSVVRISGPESISALSEMSDSLHVLDAGDKLVEGESFARTLYAYFSGPSSHAGASSLRYRLYLARFLSRQGRLDEADALLADLPDDERSDLDREVMFDLTYGGHLAQRGQFEESERRLLSAHEHMAHPNELIIVTRLELARLYERWNRPEDAAAWRARVLSPG